MWSGSEEELREILADPYVAERLEETGAFALRAAVTSHLAAAYPGAAASLLSDLRDVNLSRKNLARIADRIMFKGPFAIQIDKNKDAVKERDSGAIELGMGFWAAMSTYSLQFAGLKYTEGNYDPHYFWEKYKEYMEPTVGPEDLEQCHEAVRVFEEKMKSVIEEVPGLRLVFRRTNETVLKQCPVSG